MLQSLIYTHSMQCFYRHLDFICSFFNFPIPFRIYIWYTLVVNNKNTNNKRITHKKKIIDNLCISFHSTVYTILCRSFVSYFVSCYILCSVHTEAKSNRRQAFYWLILSFFYYCPVTSTFFSNWMLFCKVNHFHMISFGIRIRFYYSFCDGHTLGIYGNPEFKITK